MDQEELAKEAFEWFTVTRIRRTRRRLLRWGRRNYRKYAWREEDDPWLTFVAEFLLQRTRASQVEPVFRLIQDKYPTPYDMRRIKQNGTEDITRTLGLHRRGRFLCEIAEEIGRRDDKLVEEPGYLLSLPGVGGYTAAAWMSLHRNMRAAIIDSNVARWLSRMTCLPYNRDPRGIVWVQRVAEALTPRRVFREYNYAVLDFTMDVCAPRTPKCEICPLSSDCCYVIKE